MRADQSVCMCVCVVLLCRRGGGGGWRERDHGGNIQSMAFDDNKVSIHKTHTLIEATPGGDRDTTPLLVRVRGERDHTADCCVSLCVMCVMCVC
jgi:hypothetical protein